jgi:D-glycero-D-manno-heptose 1,7-bisphosphate phosphatase
MKPAVFIDRDGTLIEHVHYLSDPARVKLMPGAADALNLLKEKGIFRVVISNQSAVGRGLLTLERLEEIHQEMVRQLAEQNADVDAIYFCPVSPTTADRTTIDHPDRKPAPGMLLRAAKEHDLDLANSWMIGDLLSDTLAGRNAGCRATILVRTGQYDPQLDNDSSVDYVENDLIESVKRILSSSPCTQSENTSHCSSPCTQGEDEGGGVSSNTNGPLLVRGTSGDRREQLIEYARQMRKKSTDAELRLWSRIKNKKLGGYKFRRQHAADNYILDFFCPEANLAIELDGEQHYESDQLNYDEQRTQKLNLLGIRVIRFSDYVVLKDTGSVIRTIFRELLSKNKSNLKY